jgi:hypothetical protein
MTEADSLRAFIDDLETMRAHLQQQEAQFKLSALEAQALIDRLKAELDRNIHPPPDPPPHRAE